MVAGFGIQEVAGVVVGDVGGQDVVGGVVQGFIAAKCNDGRYLGCENNNIMQDSVPRS